MRFSLDRSEINKIIKNFPENKWESEFQNEISNAFGLYEIVNYYIPIEEPPVWAYMLKKSSKEYFEEKIKPNIKHKKEYFDFLKNNPPSYIKIESL